MTLGQEVFATTWCWTTVGRAATQRNKLRAAFVRMRGLQRTDWDFHYDGTRHGPWFNHVALRTHIERLRRLARL